jgi:hypothetical protein
VNQELKALIIRWLPIVIETILNFFDEDNKSEGEEK